jgi:HemY protein
LEPDELARARAAKRLVSGNPKHIESRILLAQVALDAGLTGEARRQIEAAEAEGLHQRRLCLLLAEVEEQERGNTEAGRLAQRDALRRAATAEPDPHWQCTNCHTVHQAWHPKCGACGSVATIEWASAVEPAGLPVIAG